MKFKNLAALVALSVCSSVALAQTTVNDNTSATSGSNSNSGSTAINKVGVVSGNSTSGSSSDSTSNSGAISVSKGGGAEVTGGNAAATAGGGQGGGGGSSDQGQLQGQKQGQQANNSNTVAPSQSTTINSTAPDHITQDIHTSGSTTVKTVPSVVVPNLPSVINNDMCIVSAALGGSGVGFSVGIGLQYRDEDCIRRINARQLYNMGYQKAALALMAQDQSISKALNDAGYSNLGEPLPPSQPEKLVMQKENAKQAVEEKAISKTPPRSRNEYEPNPVKYDLQPLVDPSKI